MPTAFATDLLILEAISKRSFQSTQETLNPRPLHRHFWKDWSLLVPESSSYGLKAVSRYLSKMTAPPSAKTTTQPAHYPFLFKTTQVELTPYFTIPPGNAKEPKYQRQVMHGTQGVTMPWSQSHYPSCRMSFHCNLNIFKKKGESLPFSRKDLGIIRLGFLPTPHL